MYSVSRTEPFPVVCEKSGSIYEMKKTCMHLRCSPIYGSHKVSVYYDVEFGCGWKVKNGVCVPVNCEKVKLLPVTSNFVDWKRKVLRLPVRQWYYLLSYPSQLSLDLEGKTLSSLLSLVVRHCTFGKVRTTLT